MKATSGLDLKKVLSRPFCLPTLQLFAHHVPFTMIFTIYFTTPIGIRKKITNTPTMFLPNFSLKKSKKCPPFLQEQTTNHSSTKLLFENS